MLFYENSIPDSLKFKEDYSLYFESPHFLLLLKENESIFINEIIKLKRFHFHTSYFSNWIVPINNSSILSEIKFLKSNAK